MKHVRNDQLKFPVTLSLHPKNNKTGKKLNVIDFTRTGPVAGSLNHSNNIHCSAISSSEFLGRQLTAFQVQQSLRLTGG
jgi:hypothetical protein